jgi:pilus assembly protein FimV
MIVTCEACFTSFNVNDELIKPSGSKVRCSKCHKVFRAYPPIPEDIEPPPLTELSDPAPEYTLSPPLFKTSQSDQTGDAAVLPVDFKDIAEFDFSELDKLLEEDGKEIPGKAFSDLEVHQPPVTIPSSGEPLETFDFSETTDKQTELDFSDISLDMPEVKDWQDKPGPVFEAPVFMEAEDSDPLSDKADKTLEQALSEITLDESFDRADDNFTGVDIESEEETASFETEPKDFSSDEFGKSLEMDFTDISLISAAESDSAADQKKGASETSIKPDQKPVDVAFPEDTLIGFDDIETLELTDIEGLLEKQEVSAGTLNEGVESFQRTDVGIFPLSPSSTETEQPLEMDDHYLTFDELQLDLDDSKSATLQQIKESFHPPLSETAAPRTDPSPQPEPVSRESVSGDKGITADADIEEDLEDTRPAPKKGISPAILIAIILSVIAAAVYGGYMLLNSMGISIPFISQPTPSKVSDPGNLSIKAFDISSKFVDNSKIGKLFVITGKVKNEYPMARGSIQISGKIYTKDKVLAKTETVFCGNMLSDIDLTNADSATLKQRLQNQSGDNQINQKVLPGTAIPFMIVFTNLPANLEEFTTEVINSVAS